MHGRSITSAIVVIAVTLPLAACGSPAATPADNRLHAEYDKATGKLQRLEYDKNNDGKTDMWADMDGTRVVKIEVDENGDGTVDRWEYYADARAGAADQAPEAGRTGEGDATPASAPRLERIERATRHDGTISRRDFFEHGALARVEEDTNGDGRLDKWETYANGSLSITALDTKGRGTPDRRLVYRPNGSLDHIETDPTGSGTFQPQKP